MCQWPCTGWGKGCNIYGFNVCLGLGLEPKTSDSSDWCYEEGNLWEDSSCCYVSRGVLPSFGDGDRATLFQDTACPRCDGAQVNNEHWCCGGSFSPGETCWPPVGGSTPAPSPSTPPPDCEINGVYDTNAPDGCSGYGCGVCEPLNMIAKFDDPGANQCSINSAEPPLGGTYDDDLQEWVNPSPNCCYV